MVFLSNSFLCFVCTSLGGLRIYGQASHSEISPAVMVSVADREEVKREVKREVKVTAMASTFDAGEAPAGAGGSEAPAALAPAEPGDAPPGSAAERVAAPRPRRRLVRGEACPRHKQQKYIC